MPGSDQQSHQSQQVKSRQLEQLHESKREKPPETNREPVDPDLASKPSRERERLLDAERRDEMNEHDDLRVDGKHYATPEQAEAVREADDPAGAHLGARDEQVDRTQGPPAMGTRPAEGKGERPTPDQSN